MRKSRRGLTVDAGLALETFLNAKRTPGQGAIDVVFVPTREDALVKELDDLVAFSDPVRKGVRELIVTGPGVPPLVSLEDVGGRAIHVRKSSDHYSSLVRLDDCGVGDPERLAEAVRADE